MFRHMGGETVAQGFYWNADRWQVTLIDRQGGELPGARSERYARVPVLAMLFVAPIMGALYVFFLPFIGVAMVLDYLARRVAHALRAGAITLLAAVAPRWQPGQAHLAEREKKQKKERTEKTEGEADEK